MGDNSTEITAPKAPSLGGNTEFNLLDGRHSPCSIIHRMPISFVRQIINFVHFLCGKGHGWWILHNAKIPILLSQLLASESILLQIFYLKGLCKSFFILFYLSQGRQRSIIPNIIKIRHLEAGSLHILDILYGYSLMKLGSNIYQLSFPHAVYQQICRALCQNRGTDLILPIIIVGKPPQTCFNASNNNRHLLSPAFPQLPGINQYSPLWPLACLAARRIGIIMPKSLGSSIAIQLRIQITARHKKAQPRFTQAGKVLCMMPIRLRNNPHLIAMFF